MKKIFVKPMAETKVMEAETLLLGSTVGASSTPVIGTEDNHFVAGAKGSFDSVGFDL